MSRRAYTDGNYRTPQECGPLMPEAPFREYGDPTAYVYRQEFEQFKEYFQFEKIGSRGPKGTRLVEESNPSDLGGGIFRWTRTYALVPDRQIFAGGSVSTYTEEIAGLVVTWTQSTGVVEVWDFFYAPGNTWMDIPLYQAEKVISANGNTYVEPERFYNYSGRAFTTIASKPISIGGLRVIEDSKLDRWAGAIHRRATPLSKRVSIVDLLQS